MNGLAFEEVLRKGSYQMIGFERARRAARVASELVSLRV